MNRLPQCKRLTPSLQDISLDDVLLTPLLKETAISEESFVFIDYQNASTSSLLQLSETEGSVSPYTGQTGRIWAPELITNPDADNVYCQVLDSLLNAIGRTDDYHKRSGIKDQILFNYLKRSFQFAEAKHNELLSIVVHKITPPDVTLQLGIIEARNLKRRNINGQSNPYCSAWISSDRQNCCDTSMIRKSLDPVWNETFNFAVNDVNQDVLQLEIWDYDGDETVKGKMSRIRNLRGGGIFLKKMAVNAMAFKSPGKVSHKFLGLLNVQIKSIPFCGLERCWYQLEGRDKSKVKDRGEIRLNLTVSATRTDAAERFTFQESFEHYERLLKIVVEHELDSDAEWRGVLPNCAAVILRQFAAHRGLRRSVTDACCWSVYSTALHKRTLDLVEMLNLIQRLYKSINGDGNLPEEELVDVFWTAADSFVVAALSSIRHLRTNPQLSKQPEQLLALLKCLKELNTLGSERPGFSQLQERIGESVTMGAADCFSRIIGDSNPMCDDDYGDHLKNVIRICQSLTDDLTVVLTVYHETFEQIWQIPAFTIVYSYYDGHLTDTSKPVVDNITKTLKSIRASSIVSLALEASGEVPQVVAKQNEADDTIASRLSMGEALFNLYLSLQQFHKLSASLPMSERENIRLAPFYTWFETAVDRWLDIAFYNAMIRIGKAVYLDNLQTVDDMVKHSSSAVDAVDIFHSMKKLREQLDWPDEKEALSFVIKLMDKVKESATIYALAIRLKLERLYSDSPTSTDSSAQQPFFISHTICSAINSVLHVQKSIHPLAEEIGLYRSDDNNKLLCPTRENLVENVISDVDEKLDEIFDAIARRFEVEVAKLIKSVMESNFCVGQTDNLNSYIGDQLRMLHNNLDRGVFIRVFNIIYQHILKKFLKVTEEKVEEKRQPDCFRQWKELLDIIEHCFHNPYHKVEEEEENKNLSVEIRRLLKFYGTDTCDLIHEYRLDRWKQMSESSKEVPAGSLSVRAIIIDDTLNIDVLNARHLKTIDGHGSIDPYVKIQLLPTHRFPDAVVLKSKVHKRTLFPLFEEKFTYSLPKSMPISPESCIMFTLKNNFLIGANELMSEHILSFKQIISGDPSVDMNDLEQMILPLAKPLVNETESEYLDVLEGRTWDKAAKDFAKEEKNRMRRIQSSKNSSFWKRFLCFVPCC